MSKPKSGDTLILVGTRKGAFVFSSDESRESWQMRGPHWAGSDIFHVVHDHRGDGKVWALRNDPVFGSEIHWSNDNGDSWESPRVGPQFSDDTEMKVSRFWHLALGRESEPDVAYVGAEPAALFKTTDGGETWDDFKAITNHSTREFWFPGAGGLCLHSITVDPDAPDRIMVGISAAGVFGTQDEGETWQPMNKGVRADFMPERLPEFGQCPHKLLSHPTRHRRLYQQNHCGVYRSDDGGNDWIDVSDGLPSRFGLALGLHQADPDTLFVLPEDNAVGDDVGGGVRYVSDAKFRVYRSRNAGESWEALSNGLPQDNAYLHCMREGMAVDANDPCGVYVGTSTGQLYFSRDAGESWELMADLLPPINSVEATVLP